MQAEIIPGCEDERSATFGKQSRGCYDAVWDRGATLDGEAWHGMAWSTTLLLSAIDTSTSLLRYQYIAIMVSLSWCLALGVELMYSLPVSSL